MRRYILILLAFAGSLLLSTGGGVPVSAAVPVTATISIDRDTPEQWLCEQECNSDLNLPRTPNPVFALQGGGVLPGSLQSDPGRTTFRFEAAFREAEAQKTITEQNFHNRSSVLQPVDYYVYRLRRLII